MAESVVQRVDASVRLDSAQRRLVDIVVAGSLLVLLAPLLVVLAVLIRVDSPGAVLFRQIRVGRDGREFRICKFRSMGRDAERTGPLVTSSSDSRVTRVGRMLRASKLDELPQLWNVLVGDMTLIGPRPEVPRYIVHYLPEEYVLFLVRPGMTGPGQLYFTADLESALDTSADPEREYVEHQLHDKLAVELDYLRHRSLSTDLHVIASTVKIMSTPRGRSATAVDGSSAVDPAS